MSRHGHSTAIGKFAKIHHDRQVSEIRRLDAALRGEQGAAGAPGNPKAEVSPTALHAE
jgi:hypothetical protein